MRYRWISGAIGAPGTDRSGFWQGNSGWKKVLLVESFGNDRFGQGRPGLGRDSVTTPVSSVVGLGRNDSASYRVGLVLSRLLGVTATYKRSCLYLRRRTDVPFASFVVLFLEMVSLFCWIQATMDVHPHPSTIGVDSCHPSPNCGICG